MQYDFEIEYKKGKENKAANALSKVLSCTYIGDNEDKSIIDHNGWLDFKFKTGRVIHKLDVLKEDIECYTLVS